MGRPALAVGGIALIGAGIAVGLGWWWPSSTQLSAEVSTQIRAVQIDLSSGDVDIRTADVSTTTVHQKFSYHWNQAPGNAYRVTGDQLVLADCGDNCSVDYDVVVPRGIAVTGQSQSGDIRIDGAVGTEVTSNSGDVHVIDSTGPVTVEARSGDIEISLRSPQDVRAQANSGDVEVTVPNDRYRVQGSSDSGDRSVDVVQDPAAPHLLDLNTNSGDVTVRTA